MVQDTDVITMEDYWKSCIAYRVARIPVTLSEYDGHCCHFEWQKASHGPSATVEFFVLIAVAAITVKFISSWLTKPLCMQPSVLVACSKPGWIGRVATGKASGVKMMGMMEVGALIVWMGWHSARLSVHLLSSPYAIKVKTRRWRVSPIGCPRELIECFF